MYRIIIHKKVFKFIKTRSDLEKTVIREKIDLLKLNPTSHSELDIKMNNLKDKDLRCLVPGGQKHFKPVRQGLHGNQCLFRGVVLF